jgi:predicted metal-dependent peptidase
MTEKNYPYPDHLRVMMSDPILKEMTTCRTQLLNIMPFIGVMITKLDMEETTTCKTAATDGKKLYWNRKFIEGLTRKQRIFLLAHEVLHIVYNHVGNRSKREKAIWNMACDYNVNYTLIKEGIGEPPAGILYDDKYTDQMSVFEIYDLLIKNAVKVKVTLDEHLDLEEEESDKKDDDKNKEDGGGGKSCSVWVMGEDGPPKLTKEQLDKLKDEIKSSIISAAQQTGAGNLPAGISKALNQLVNPKLDWRSMLDSYIRSALRDDYSYQNMSRRSWGAGGAIFPGLKFTEKVEIFAAIDASGSTTKEMVTDFVSELTGIVGEFYDYKIDLICFDTKVYNHVVITPDNVEDLYDYRVRGDGGTLFECIFAYMREEGIEPARLVVLTDGEPNLTWGDENYCDTIFIIHTNDHIEAPYGLTAHYSH